jgi:elongation factor Ts
MSTTITAADINKLRQMTGAGMMDCRKALTENNGDFEAAIDWLRKKGQKVAALRGDRDAKEGVVLAKTTADNKTGITLCLSCETDFVSKNGDFIAFAQSIMDAAIANNVKNTEELNSVEINGAKIADLVNDKLASIGEKIGISKFERIDAEFVSSYIQNGCIGWIEQRAGRSGQGCGHADRCHESCCHRPKLSSTRSGRKREKHHRRPDQE